ncbi:MAG: cytochrome b562 [Marinomonadaceae bacterium]
MYKRLFIGALATLALSTNILAHGHCEATPLHKNMEKIKTELRGVASNIKSGNNQKAEEQAGVVIVLLKEARTEMPHMFVSKKLAGDELAQEEENYQSAIDDTIDLFTSLEMALENDDTEVVKGLMEEIGKQRHDGHVAFKEDC